MNQFETNAKKAESEIHKMFLAADSAYRPWQFVNYSLENIILKTTFDEILILCDQPAYLRPGYKVFEDKVYVPNFFVKLAGVSSTTYPEFYEKISKVNDNKLIYKSISEFNSFPCEYISEKEISSITYPDGLIDRNKLLESRIYHYNHLRKEYQNILIDKINLVITNKDHLFSNSVQKDDTSKIIFSLLNLDEKILNLFNNFDFQENLPCIVIQNENKELFSHSSAYVLALLNLLGFDLIIISSFGYADVENIINTSLINIFHNSSFKSNPDMTKPKIKRLGSLFALTKKGYIIILLLALVAGFFLVRSQYFTVNKTHDSLKESQAMYKIDIAGQDRLSGTEPTDQNQNAAVMEEESIQNSSSISDQTNQNQETDILSMDGPIEVSSVYPGLRGTIEKLSEKTTEVDPNKNDIVITMVDPDENLQPGVETWITVELEYNLVSNDSAILDLCLNTGGNHFETSFNAMESIIWPVDKGKGKCRFTFPILPKRWEDGSPFWILAGFNDPDSRSRIYNTNSLILGLSDDNGKK